MRVKSNIAPVGAFEIQDITASQCTVVFFENVKETKSDAPDETGTSFEWDEYSLSAVYRVGLETKIGENVGLWLATAKAIESAKLASAVRQKRDELLSSCDWTVLGDAKTTKTDWKTYRQALRDVPEQAGFPHDVDWPVMPV